VVEGSAALAVSHDAVGNAFRRFEHVQSWYPYHSDTFSAEPVLASRISRWPIVSVVRESVDFKGGLRVSAIKVQDVIT